MRYAFAILFSILAMLGCSASAAHTEAKVATGIAVVANTGLDVLGKVYEQQLVGAIIAAGEASYATVEARNAAIDKAEAAVIQRWVPVWGDPPEVVGGRLGAWTVFRAAHTAWAAAIEAGGDGAPLLVQMRVAYCALLLVLPADAASVIRVPLVTCADPPALPASPAVLPTVTHDAGTDASAADASVADAAVHP